MYLGDFGCTFKWLVGCIRTLWSASTIVLVSFQWRESAKVPELTGSMSSTLTCSFCMFLCRSFISQ
jgi:hypothetical protein